MKWDRSTIQSQCGDAPTLDPQKIKYKVVSHYYSEKINTSVQMTVRKYYCVPKPGKVTAQSNSIAGALTQNS